MSTWLADAVAAYVDQLDEREFDAPFIALLQRLGYTNVHLTHGSYELGKDFIARTDSDGIITQWCFQSKVGNIAAAAWRTEVRPQVDLMREGGIVHPDFDPRLPRRIVVVTTGRLKGSAGLEMASANDYAESRGETVAELWDADFLVPALQETLIADRDPRDQARILEMVGRLRLGLGNRADVSALSRTWLSQNQSAKSTWGDVLTGCLLSHEAAHAGREDLAMQIAWHLIRAFHREKAAGNSPDPQILAIAHSAFETIANNFWDQVCAEENLLEVTSRASSPPAAFLVHPIKVARFCEAIAMLVLWNIEKGNAAEADTVGGVLAEFVTEAPGISHPVGEEWAFTILVTAAALSATGHTDETRTLVKDAAVWLLDRVEDGLALPPVGARAADVVNGVLAPLFAPRRAPGNCVLYALTVVIDAAILLEQPDLAANIVHDMDAFRAIATLTVPTGVGKGMRVARVEYPDDPGQASHHSSETSAKWPVLSSFDSLAIWATYRDRHLPGILAPLFNQSDSDDVQVDSIAE